MTFDLNSVWDEEFNSALRQELDQSGYPLEEWFWSGKTSPVESVADWASGRGVQLVQRFIDWYEDRPDVNVWVTPEGTPAIELAVNVMFGSVPFRGYVDLVLEIGAEHPALVVVDLKTGVKPPSNPRQLALYCSAIEIQYGIRPKYATYFMHRGVGPRGASESELTFFQQPILMSSRQHSIPYQTKMMEAFQRGVDHEVFIASPGDNCRRCGVAKACIEVGGEDAGKYNR